MREAQLSKVMSLALRHEPHRFGLALDDAGWTTISSLVEGLRAQGIETSEASVRAVVGGAVKQRHEIDGDRIRARYGHSLPGAIELDIAVPPHRLFHGTTEAAATHIDVDGLRPMGRQFVHLSPSRETAARVGRRRPGELVIYEVDTTAARGAGVEFRRANDDTWLTGDLPAAFLRRRLESD